jgi:hypothetical protein
VLPHDVWEEEREAGGLLADVIEELAKSEVAGVIQAQIEKLRRIAESILTNDRK